MTIKKDDLPPRVARWGMALQEFEFKVKHKAGTKMTHVYALSALVEAQDNDSWIKAVQFILKTRKNAIVEYIDYQIPVTQITNFKIS